MTKEEFAKIFEKIETNSFQFQIPVGGIHVCDREKFLKQTIDQQQILLSLCENYDLLHNRS